jgi:FAD dependent oxidoreductase
MIYRFDQYGTRICLRGYFTLSLLPLLMIMSFAPLVRAQEQTEVLVLGGGTGGTAAAIQAARMGVKVILVEPTRWLGGMLSAAGVSAIDGNHALPSGIWGEFRAELYKVYGGPKGVATGWVSETQFEPHVGDSILKSIVASLPNITVLFDHRFLKVVLDVNRIAGADCLDLRTGRTVRILAKQTVDATELGDVMASAGVPYDLGMESSAITGEGLHIPETNDIIQDLTYTAVLKDYGPAADCTIVKPSGYDPMEFDCCCKDICTDTTSLFSKVGKQQMLDYGRLPHGKHMLNWPNHGNDIYLNLVEMDPLKRQRELEKAKQKTLRFVYYIQTSLGYRNLGLANDEFPTADRLPLIPYHREGRRLRGVVRFNAQHIAKPFHESLSLYRTGIAVGDYPIDHHHRQNPRAPQHLGFYPVPSFSIPMGALIPAHHVGLIVAEKGISVSNAANGTTRLQPVVMLTGQAAGALAALCINRKKDAREVPVRDLQSSLLLAGAYIMPYYDVTAFSPVFLSIQKIGATGILRGIGAPHGWANRTWFYPDSLVDAEALAKDLKPIFDFKPSGKELSIGNSLKLVRDFAERYRNRMLDAFPAERLEQHRFSEAWVSWGLSRYDPHRPITRAELAVLLDKTLDPFMLLQVDLQGQFRDYGVTPAMQVRL